MDISYVNSHLIFETIVGSHAYGTQDETSDIDKAGVLIPDKSYFYGTQKFEQFQGFPNEDKTIYDIRKAISLIADNNPSMMCLLWSPERCYLTLTPYWSKIIDNRNLFLSKKSAYTFTGYSVSMLHKIKTHRQFILNGKPNKPNRIDFGLPEISIFPSVNIKTILSSVMDFIPRDQHENFLADLDEVQSIYVTPTLLKYTDPSFNPITMSLLNSTLKSQANSIVLSHQYIKDEFVEMAKKELKYYSAFQQWTQYCGWEKSRNKKRAEMELRWGFDCKYALHAIRLSRMGVEILETGIVNVDRTNLDSEELRSIKQGAWSYERVEEYAKNAETKIMELYKTSSVLPKYPDREKIDKLCIEVVDQYLRDNDGK